MDNLGLQTQLVDLMKKGTLVLTETDRLKHHVQRRYRLSCTAGGKAGWEAPAVMTLNQWVDRTWEELWPMERPASPFSLWKTIGSCIEESPPPEPLLPDTGLVRALEVSFENCLRYGVDPGKGEPANRLVEWRRKIWNSCCERLRRDGLFHRASLPERLGSALRRRQDLLPRRVAVVGFEFSGHWEQQLLGLLCARPEGLRIALPRGGTHPRALAAADPEQELYAILEDLTGAAARVPLHELAVVLLDSSLYGPMLSKHLQDLFGPPVEGEGAAYNLLPDRPLTAQPLFRAAFLPFAFARSGESRTAFFSLLRSPFYGVLARSSRTLGQWDRTWRDRGVEAGLSALMHAVGTQEKDVLPLKGDELEKGLLPFLDPRSRSGSDWAGELEDFWWLMEFPVIANECDQISWQKLQEILEQFKRVFGGTSMKSFEFVSWISAAAEGVLVQRVGFEEAGIQVIGRVDARGLAFHRLYVPGLAAGTLPQPARPLPFLSPEERRQVPGATLEGQFQYAAHLFGNLYATAGELLLSRPLMTLAGEPCLPSPFWPQDREEKVPPVIPWRHAVASFRRTRWVSECLRGFQDSTAAGGEWGQTAGKAEEPASTREESIFRVSCFECPKEISVSDLEVLIACPGSFFFQKLLVIEGLQEPVRGVDPRDRGRTVHSILAHFARNSIAECALERLDEILRAAAAAELEPLLSAPCWNVEKRRLLGGDADGSGLLLEWLGREWVRIEQGWRWIAMESDFRGLLLEGCSIALRGRLDRLDAHPEEGLFCWDYKTGTAPSGKEVLEDLARPQLPAYLMAVKRGLLAEAPKNPPALAAGYIDLRSVRYLKHQPCIKPGEDVDGLLSRWEEKVRVVLNRLREGLLSPKWRESGCDAACEYKCLCGLFLREDAGSRNETRAS